MWRSKLILTIFEVIERKSLWLILKFKYWIVCWDINRRLVAFSAKDNFEIKNQGFIVSPPKTSTLTPNISKKSVNFFCCTLQSVHESSAWAPCWCFLFRDTSITLVFVLYSSHNPCQGIWKTDCYLTNLVFLLTDSLRSTGWKFFLPLTTAFHF